MKRSQLVILFVTIFIDLLGFGLILPLLPIYIQHYGGSAWVGGALMTSFSVMQFIFAPIWGSLSDRIGRRPLILLSLLGSAVSYFFFGAAPNLLILFIARLSAGVLSSASIPTAQAYIADVTTPQERSGGMAIIGAAFGLGFAFGPVFSAVLSNHPVFGITALAMPAYAAALLSLVNFAFAFFMLPESHTNRDATPRKAEPFGVFKSLDNALRRPMTGPPLIVFAFTTFAFTAVETSFSWLVILRFDRVLHETAATVHNLHLQAGQAAYSALSALEQKNLFEKAATSATGTIFGIVGFTTLLVQGAVMGGLAKKVGEGVLIKAGTIILVMALLGTAVAPSLMWLQIGSAFIAMGNGILNPSLTSLITQFADPAKRGEISGVQQGLGSLARVIAPTPNNLLVGLPILILGVSAGIPFYISSVLMFIGFLLALRLRTAVLKEKEEVAT